MPDVWTTNPPKLKKALKGMGAHCGTESRVLHPRDPEWTCQLDSAAFRGDIYIHHVGKLLLHPYFGNCLFLALAFGILAGLLWGKYFWRRTRTHSQLTASESSWPK